MRRLIGLSLLLLLGCAPSTAAPDTRGAPGSPAGEPAWGGGGGPVAGPVPENCPVDFVDQLRVEIAAVPERMYRTALESQWKVIDARANSSGPSEMAFAVGGFTSMVDHYERRNELSADHADRMRRLVGCYQ